MSEMTQLILPVLFYACQMSKTQNKVGCHGLKIPQLFGLLENRQIKDRAGLKQYLLSMMDEGQCITAVLYILINEQTLCWCLEYAAVWLVENTFFYGADNRSCNRTTTELSFYAIWIQYASCDSQCSSSRGTITYSLVPLGLVYTVQNISNMYESLDFFCGCATCTEYGIP